MATKQRLIPVTNEIKSFFHCKQCLASLPPGTSPREWASMEVGFTPIGIQIWCKRHECNIMHMDFQGRKHPANTGRTPKKEEVH